MAKIMIVDDEEDIRLSVKLVLEKNGYTVVSAKNGDECLQLLSKEKPDLVLMDVLMPGTRVNDILAKIKKTKVIIFSVVNLNEGILGSQKIVPPLIDFPNVVDYINKPVETSLLLGKIKKALG